VSLLAAAALLGQLNAKQSLLPLTLHSHVVVPI
jgi:hypothetical protein